jgi:murein L,D-transpeptidase YcbB/YkuD
MRAMTSQGGKYWLAGAAILAVAAAAFGLGSLYPPVGPTSGAIAAAQGYVENLAGEEIPASGRYVLVDAASARLFMIEDGRVRDTMRVIVGKPAAATPALRGELTYATLNPYWNVPSDLAQTLIAPRVLSDGSSYLSERGYEVVSTFGAGARIIPPDSIDWAAVAAGRLTVHVRQRPGAANSMGRMKFSLADANGIFLHDTPKKELFALAQRNLSNGCVRLEDAPRFARWLLRSDPPLAAAVPEQHVALPGAVPIAIAYLDAPAQMRVAGLQ